MDSDSTEDLAGQDMPPVELTAVVGLGRLV